MSDETEPISPPADSTNPTESETPPVEDAAPIPDSGALVITVAGFTEASTRRLEAAGLVEITEDSDLAMLAAVSTRLPLRRALGHLEDLRSETRPVVVLCHAGGERTAQELLASGADALAAEGDEAAILRFAGWAEPEEVLVRTHLGRQDPSWGGNPGQNRDPATNLPGLSEFELRLADLSGDAPTPRLLVVRAIDLADAKQVLDRTTFGILRRRIAAACTDLVRRRNADLFEFEEDTYVVVGRHIDADTARRLAVDLRDTVRSFAPAGYPIDVAIGTAGPEVATDIEAVRELAWRALEAAQSGEHDSIVDAGDLSQSLASATELDATLGMAARVDEAEGRPGHSVRVADYTAELSRELGLHGWELARVGLAARLHSIGKLRPVAEEENVDWAARFVAPSSGRSVAATIRHQHERWDGEGVPDGLEGETIPLGARLLAVADAYDNWMHPAGGGEPLTVAEIVAALTEGSGNLFDPAIVEAAIAIIGRIAA